MLWLLLSPKMLELGVAEECQFRLVRTDENAEWDLELWGDILEGLMARESQSVTPPEHSLVTDSVVSLKKTQAGSPDI
ncbi:hypothetical protein NDU88_004771 [Pleurodeles waltl]|uniref:Uncharacterized protein n=1 Tax=Pleurodeles waltl TaxID=8319 RepID=A0AAV7PIH1_PLEWA|nr:hypothetical protein NDU88_004771 [Pleurodeles waltl]